MNKYTLLLFGILIAFLSCDGRDRVNKTPKEILVENKLLDSFSENIKYFPEKYTETTTDTILSNGFRVKIRYFSHMKEYVTESYTKDSINYKKHYYDFVSRITVYKDDKEVYKKDLYKRSLEEHSKEFAESVQKLIMNPPYIDEENSLKNNKVYIVIPLCNSDTSTCLFYYAIIDNKGDFEYRLMPNNNNFYH
ncbi:hypothetical protein [Olleya sp. R77988]|uniref:hypothetical protein n=1 Tax=Olleya sp. R77988 TaxID=3093875 RepID=UPI0037C77DD4